MQPAPTPEPISSKTSGESWVKKLGPGLITGAADDDPSGIAAYSQAGAQFGFRPASDSALYLSIDGRKSDCERQNRTGSFTNEKAQGHR